MFKKILIYFLLFIYSIGNIPVFFVYANSDTIDAEQNEDSKKAVENEGDSGQNISKEVNEEGNNASESLENGEKSQKDSKEGSENYNLENQEIEHAEENTENTENINFTSKIEFQNPSYLLEKNEAKRDTYTCDKARQECKVNLKFVGVLNEEELTASKYICETSFGFTTDEENTCNPKTIIFPEGESEVKYKIILKNDESIFEEGSFVVKNENLSLSGENGEKQDTEDTTSESPSDEEGDSSVSNSRAENEGNDQENVGEEKELQLIIQSGASFSPEAPYTVLCPEEGTGICKINFLVESTEDCIFDFGLETETGYEQKCNPGYIDFPIGDTTISLKIGEKTQNYTIKNTPIEREFGLILGTQTPNYLFETDDENSFICDRSKKICKVNFDLRESFGKVSSSKFSCQHSFSFGETGQEQKCNPNTIEVPLGEHTLEFSMISGTTIKKRIITITNEGYQPKKTTTSSTSSSETIHIPNNEIIIQSGLDENLTCEKKECKVNFNYDTEKVKGVSCKWDFGEAQYNKASAKKCNPGYVTYGPGTHLVSLKIFQKNKKSNYVKKEISFTNTYKKQKLAAKINLQGRLAQYKKYFVNRVFCTGVESCALNFDGRNSVGEIQNYHWDFGNGRTFEGKNPKMIEFFPGEYTVQLTVSDGEGAIDMQEFFVKVSKEQQSDEEIQAYIFELFPAMFQLKNSFFSWYNGLYFFENKKLFEQRVQQEQEQLQLFLRKNKNSATVYGSAAPGAVIIISETSDVLFWKGLFVKNQYEVQADEKGKFKQRIVYDSQGNFTLQAVVEDEKLGKIDFGKEKYFSVTDTGSILSAPTKDKREKNIFEPVVIDLELQGKVGKNKTINGKNITCIGTCSINLKSNSTGSIASEHWDFGNGEKSEKKNPKSIKYKNYGSYTITYTVVDEKGAIITEYFYVKYIKKSKKTRKKKLKKSKTGPVKLQIEVQGKIGKSKKLEPGKLSCYGTCKVNFDGRKSSGAYKKLIWDFGNGEYFTGENPKYITYKKHGTYTVTLTAEGYNGKRYTKNFIVVFGEEQGKGSGLKSLEEEQTERIENMLVEKRQYTKLDIFYLSLIFSITLGGGGVSFLRIRK